MDCPPHTPKHKKPAQGRYSTQQKNKHKPTFGAFCQLLCWRSFRTAGATCKLLAVSFTWLLRPGQDILVTLSSSSRMATGNSHLRLLGALIGAGASDSEGSQMWICCCYTDGAETWACRSCLWIFSCWGWWCWKWSQQMEKTFKFFLSLFTSISANCCTLDRGLLIL